MTTSLIEPDPLPGRPLTMPDRIYAALKHRILTCSLLPGQRLVEKDLCAEPGFSRTPLREALNRLALEGLVTLTPFCGYSVTPVTVQDIDHLCEVRRLVESEVAALAARRASAEDIDQLRQLAPLRYQPGNRATYARYLTANRAFHLALVRCTANPRLEAIVMSVLDQLQRPLYLGLDVGLDARKATAEHLAVVAAVAAHRPAEARRLMAEQIARARQRITAAVEILGSAQTSLTGKADLTSLTKGLTKNGRKI